MPRPCWEVIEFALKIEAKGTKIVPFVSQPELGSPPAAYQTSQKSVSNKQNTFLRRALNISVMSYGLRSREIDKLRASFVV
jgi:hypothetical protein